MAASGCEHGTVIIAEGQTEGRGRYGKSFYSPPNSGLYISFILRCQNLNLPDVTQVTSAAAVAVCRALELITDEETEIKWVNDIFMKGKKVCGILTEAVNNCENNAAEWVIVGIGVNIDTRDFPKNLNQVAASVFSGKSAPGAKIRLGAELINTFLSSKPWMHDGSIHREYKERLMWLGCEVTVTGINGSYEATALDIDENRNLLIRKHDGTVIALSSGEVSIKEKRNL